MKRLDFPRSPRTVSSSLQGLPRVENGGELLHLHLQSCESLFQKFPARGPHQSERFSEESGLPFCQNGVIHLNHRHLVGSRKILGSHHYHRRPVKIGIGADSSNFPPAEGRTESSSVPHGGKGEIIHIPGLSRKLFPCVIPLNIAAYHFGMVQRTSLLIFLNRYLLFISHKHTGYILPREKSPRAQSMRI